MVELMRYQTIEIFNFSKKLLAIESTRLGGVSDHPFHSLNLGVFTNDSQNCVQENKEILYQDLKIEESQVASAFQCHGNDVLNVVQPGYYEGFDALMTDKKNIFLQILVADCTPILLFDPVKEVIAAIHAGWRGTVKGIIPRTLEKMSEIFNSNPADCFAYIGTCISQKFFEVDEDVVQYFEKEFYVYDEKKAKYFIDLKLCSLKALLHSGISENHVSVSPFCTVKDNHLFFSHRHEKGTTGRFGIIIGMRK
ncbi:MAG: peptidoglycan editing factor PgeF [Bacteroidetes bacterium]|nr:peptidoglycan editing factor PgeF [Bacteroidota bacterium]